MQETTLRRKPDDLVEAFVAARSTSETPLSSFLPPRSHPNFLTILRELVRIDLDHGWREGHPRPLDDYRLLFPELFDDPSALAEVAFEEYCHRLRGGEAVTPEEYSRRYGVATGNWRAASPKDQPVLLDRTRVASGDSNAPAYDLNGLGSSGISWDSDLDPVPPSQTAPPHFPRVGEQFLDFHLVAELGRGAFARVYLAQQGALAGRLVALKISPEPQGEPQTLASLLHTNIVPVYSVHQLGELHATCMPYLGSTTLAHVLQDLKGGDVFPDSGRGLLSTLHNRADTVPTTVHDTTAPPEVPLPRPLPGTTAILDMLGRLSYVEAVLWLGWRLADGLQHAHERGIIHRDIKPANVLLTDEGQPMLLDFNLAQNQRDGLWSAAGGTVAYMAPEQLNTFQQGHGQADPRSDLYALGLILFELLTRRYPFSRPGGALSEILPGLIVERQRTLPSPQACNRDLPPGIDSIIRHCLEPDPNQRYQTARQLQEDLECQRANLPLRHAPNPSWIELAGKWVRRHPRLTSSASVATLATVVLLVLGAAFVYRGQRLARAEAQQELAVFHEDYRELQRDLVTRTGDPEQLRQREQAALQVLNRYAVLDGTHSWENTPSVRHLSPAERTELRGEIGEVLLHLARVGEQLADTLPDDSRTSAFENALVMIDRAETFYSNEPPPALWERQAALLQRLGREREARQLRQRATDAPLRTARACYLAGSEHAARGRSHRAVPFLQDAVRLDPGHQAAWFVLGYCHDGLARHAEAASCYSTAIALRPGHADAWFNRGVVRLRLLQFRDAEQDFEEVLRLRPGNVEAFINRGIARYRQGPKRFGDALKDLDEALTRGTEHTRIYLLRAQVRELAGDREGAREDRAEGLKRTPNDAQGYVARGNARLRTDPAGAFQDFEAALRLNPWSREALHNKAMVLAEYRRDLRWAVSELTAALARYPDAVTLRAGRAVYRARLGLREAAHEDARECLRRDTNPHTLYMIACVYALTSTQQPDDRLEALRLVATALRKGYNRLDLLARDPDFAPVRGDPVLDELIRAARALDTPARPPRAAQRRRP